MSTELSRRNFLAGAATLSALAGAAALVGCGSSTTAADAGAAEATAADATAWLGAAPGIAEFADEQTADVVVVGAGTGGMFAAAAAAEGGASVIVIEKGEDYGSVKDDLGAVNTKLQQEDGTTFDRAQMMLDYYRYSNARTDLRLFNAWFDNSAETVDWFTDLIAAKGVTMWHEASATKKASSPIGRRVTAPHGPKIRTRRSTAPPFSANISKGSADRSSSRCLWSNSPLKTAR